MKNMSINESIILELSVIHQQPFTKVYDNYFLSPKGLLYSHFNGRLKFIQPSYKIPRDGRPRPTLRLNVNKKRIIFLQYRLTAQFFDPQTGEPFEQAVNLKGLVVNHLDGEIENDHVTNFEVTTHADNLLHRDFKNALYRDIDNRIYSMG